MLSYDLCFFFVNAVSLYDTQYTSFYIVNFMQILGNTSISPEDLVEFEFYLFLHTSSSPLLFSSTNLSSSP